MAERILRQGHQYANPDLHCIAAQRLHQHAIDVLTMPGREVRHCEHDLGILMHHPEPMRTLHPHGLWVMHQNAKVMLAMADFATRHCENVDRVLVETLRSDAMQIRVCVLMALAQYAFSHASEGVRVNAFRAASMYTGMAARMTQLLQESAAVLVPDFVAAM